VKAFTCIPKGGVTSAPKRGVWRVPSNGQIIKIADSVAYINHDIDDALRAGILTAADLPSDAIAVLGESHADRIDTMVCDLIDQNWRQR
jgi:dGTPase